MNDATVVFLLKKAAKDGQPFVVKLDGKDYVVRVEKKDRG